jgi:quercetin dioxygenase-like cupin family protein
MKIARIGDVEAPDTSGLLAIPFLEGEQSNVRIIRVGAGHALPPHRHGTSDLMLYVIAGEAELDTSDGTTPFGAGSLAFYRGDEELRVRNAGQGELMMLAFLTPKFAAS